MPASRDKFDGGEIFEVIEGLLEMCVDREKEIVGLSKKIDELEAMLVEYSARPIAKPEISPVPPGKQTVLIVDRSEVVRQKLADLLASNGFFVVGEADSGSKALQMFEANKPSIVTMDLDLEDMDGLEVTRRLLKMEPDVRVIVITGELNKSMLLSAISAGAIEFLIKPIRLSRFIQVLRKLAPSTNLGTGSSPAFGKTD